MKKYSFENDSFVIRDYQKQKTFTNFLPGIAGIKGKPIWMFYANRGQGIISFGIKNKSFPILEFSPASIALERVNYQGFRTFIKQNGKVYEPFNVANSSATELRMNNAEFSIEDNNVRNGLKTNVTYFIMPEEDYPALVRKVIITNTSSKAKDLEIYDGLSEIIPYGLGNKEQKECGNLFRAWMVVENLENQVPLYRMRSSTVDSSVVEVSQKSYFFYSYSSKGEAFRIVDPSQIFGYDVSLTKAINVEKSSFDKITSAKQAQDNCLPCGFIANKVHLDAGEEVTLIEIIGLNEKGEALTLDHKESSFDFIEAKRARNYELIEDIEKEVKTHTAFPLFDKYVSQCYMDNLLRGGYPYKLGNKVLYIYSRKHGDPERDYNWYVINPEYYSYGDGNFRDVLQNRRNDVLIKPEVEDLNVRYFASLFQIDGYNPLVIDGISYQYTGNKTYEKLSPKLLSNFTVGQLYQADENISDETVKELLCNSKELFNSKTREGYWCDHFIYLLDIIETYEKIYPDKLKDFYNSPTYRYYYSLYLTRDINHRFALINNNVIRLDSINEEVPKETEGSIWYKDLSRWIKHNDEDYNVSLFNKLYNLIYIKTATLDPMGMGLDMDGGKPGWNDALNGVAGMLGSSVTDLIELYRLSSHFEKVYETYGEDIVLSSIQDDFIKEVNKLMNVSDVEYFIATNKLKQALKDETRDGNVKELVTQDKETVLHNIKLVNKKLRNAILKAQKYSSDGLTPSYFYYKVTEYDVLSSDDKFTYVFPKSFELQTLPTFAEGVAKSFKIDLLNHKKQYQNYINSDGYDSKLKLIRVSKSLEGESMMIGRIRSFVPGWLERESCFLHMDYKFLLGMIECGLYKEFYQQIKTNFVPFMNPEKYGRSTLENSSFIATSNYSNEALQGQGFQPRLSGANSEFLSMWYLMFVGKESFTYKDGELNFTLHPLLDKSFFDKDNKVSFTFLNHVEIVYENPSRLDAYKAKVSKMKVFIDNKEIEVIGDTLSNELSHQLRDGKVAKIIATIGD